MADIFVSYTSSDRLKAFWIGQELIKLGYNPRIHEWEISAGGNIPAWMEQRHHDANHVLLVISRAYLVAPYSNWERQAAQWAAADKRPNFALPVFIEDCETPTLLAHIKRCDLQGLSEAEARAALAAYLAPATKPSTPVAFSPAGLVAGSDPQGKIGAQAGSYYAVSNIPINVPRHFLGREDDLAAIDKALKGGLGRAAISALYGLRGVGKTTLAAAYAEQHRASYRATWWIRAETIPTMRADLVGLGVRLEWVVPDEKEEPALAVVLERLRYEGETILLVYDNANNADEISPYMPHGGAAHIVLTSNAPNWSGVAAAVEIEKWPREIGADYLVAQANRPRERDAALALSEALDGLPLAHEQAAAYCARTGLSLADYRKKFEAQPAKFLDVEKDASSGYHNHRTAAKTFALAIDEAARLHPAAEQLIVCAALLAAEPIPLYLFSEGAEKFGERFASAVADNGLDEAVAALRAFALVDRELIPDERDPLITTDCIRLHRLIRQIATARSVEDTLQDVRRALINAMIDVYPSDVFSNPETWPRARRLDALALALVASDEALLEGVEKQVSDLLDWLAKYRQRVLAAYNQAQPLLEGALAIDERLFGPDHPNTAASLNNLAGVLDKQGDFGEARSLRERSLAIYEKTLGPDHPHTATILDNLGVLLDNQHNIVGALQYCERALAIRENALGPNHPETARSLSNVGALLVSQGDLVKALSYYERALEIREKTLGLDHPDRALSLNNLGFLLGKKGDLARALFYYELALAIYDKILGPSHPSTQLAVRNMAVVLVKLGRRKEAKERLKNFGIEE